MIFIEKRRPSKKWDDFTVPDQNRISETMESVTGHPIVKELNYLTENARNANPGEGVITDLFLTLLGTSYRMMF
jgi:hypothetical protein